MFDHQFMTFSTIRIAHIGAPRMNRTPYLRTLYRAYHTPVLAVSSTTLATVTSISAVPLILTRNSEPEDVGLSEVYTTMDVGSWTSRRHPY